MQGPSGSGWQRLPGPATHLEHRDVVLPVDLVGGRVEPAALLHVLVEDAAALHVAEAELAQVELRQSGGRGQKVKSLLRRHNNAGRN